MALEARQYPDLVTPNVPLVVSKCIAMVDKHLQEQGIYRLSGNSAHIQTLVGKCNAGTSTEEKKNEREN